MSSRIQFSPYMAPRFLHICKLSFSLALLPSSIRYCAFVAARPAWGWKVNFVVANVWRAGSTITLEDRKVREVVVWDRNITRPSALRGSLLPYTFLAILYHYFVYMVYICSPHLLIKAHQSTQTSFRDPLAGASWTADDLWQRNALPFHPFERIALFAVFWEPSAIYIISFCVLLRCMRSQWT